MSEQASLRISAFALAVVASLSGAAAQQATDLVAPERDTGLSAKTEATATRHMVAAANPLAAEAGLAMLRAGGSAADALVAAQAMLGLVEPQSSGLGGGAFLVWYDAATRSITTFDGRETAPAAATRSVTTFDGRETAPAAAMGDLFLDGAGKPLDFMTAVVGGRSVGVPGVVALMDTVHARYGKLDWTALFEPAAQTASAGFVVSPRLASLVAAYADGFSAGTPAHAYFFPAGQPLATGATLKNPDYAKTLSAIASGRSAAFYEGPLAAEIVAAVTGHSTNPGKLSAADLAQYKVIERAPTCIAYRGHDVCGMGPPSSGGITVGQILGMVEPFDIATLGPDDPEAWRLIGDATRLAFADRERYLADPAFAPAPLGMLNRDYLNSRSALLRRPTALPKEDVTAGAPPTDRAELRRDGISLEREATTHLVIVDDLGNVASLTSSIENAFGSRLMAGGFLLNNQLTDFAFTPIRGDRAVANRVEPGKRPRSSMAPTIVLRDGVPVYALGSPGGSAIIPYVAQTLIGLIDWKMSMQQAIAQPHLVNRFGKYELEAGTPAVELAKDLQALGYETDVRDHNSGLQGIAIAPARLTGGADPRREGIAVGD